ncbi:TetR family transcriptional regulator [Schumannella sp. 10F1B-5-1]|uniref:TetR family transcriptional regulator n=1 Tax=Schumannella sp. 10F1B-5-1 TaxID=2590780 RepID=UPI001130A04E|nr:TetR family transcriptional regulator [Schumannella sp. 10F1B-5-1]TPW72946.1 TetR family transcriptional regulator [Schumannella sp. 10F1B-5-1]
MAELLRDRSREILRAQLADAAADFCAERGFDAVTVEEIAQHIGISRATFFRYFESKEDAVVTSTRTGRGTLIQALRDAPRSPGASAMDAVRAALETTAALARERPESLRAHIRMISATASLRRRLAFDRAEQRKQLDDALAELIGSPVEAQAVASASMAASELGWALWVADESADLGDCLDRAFDLIARASEVRLA